MYAISMWPPTIHDLETVVAFLDALLPCRQGKYPALSRSARWRLHDCLLCVWLRLLQFLCLRSFFVPQLSVILETSTENSAPLSLRLFVQQRSYKPRASVIMLIKVRTLTGKEIELDIEADYKVYISETCIHVTDP
jgi:hypothetical protein